MAVGALLTGAGVAALGFPTTDLVHVKSGFDGMEIALATVTPQVPQDFAQLAENAQYLNY